jgi:hypothetical protein
MTRTRMSLVINGVTKKQTFLNFCDKRDLECVARWMEETHDWSKMGCKAQLAFEHRQVPDEAQALEQAVTSVQ